MRISDWSSDVCSSDLFQRLPRKNEPLSIESTLDNSRSGARAGPVNKESQDGRASLASKGLSGVDASLGCSANESSFCHCRQSKPCIYGCRPKECFWESLVAADRKSTRLNSSH